MIRRSRKALLPILVFFITLALGGTAVFVAQKIKGPKITEEPPKKFAKAPEREAPAPTTPTETEAATPANTCNSTQCECAFTTTAAPAKPSCSLLSVTPTEGLTNQEFTANLTCQSGSTAHHVVYLITRKQGTTTKVRLTPDTLCTGSGACTKSFKFTPSDTTRGLPAITEAGTYDLWITARSVGPDGVGGNDDDLACTDIPDDLREPTSPVACGQKGKTFVLTAALSCTLDASKTTLTAGEATTLSAAGAGGKAPYTFDQWAVSPTGGSLSGTTGASVTWTSPASLTASTTYTATVRVKDAFSPTRTANCQKTLTVNPATTPTHKACSNNTCVTVSGAGSNECQTDTDCQAATHKVCQNYTCTTITGAGTNQCQTDAGCQGGNQKPLCGKITAEPATGNAPLTVTFTVTGAKDNDGTVVVYEFDFGDESGKTVSQNSITHTYQNPGEYETRVWVRDNLSLRSDLTDDCRVTVKAYQPGAAVPPPAPTTPPATTPPPTTPQPQATSPAAPTGSREMTMLALLGGLAAILLGGWWYAHLDPAWQKFEKGLTRFWERK